MKKLIACALMMLACSKLSCQLIKYEDEQSDYDITMFYDAAKNVTVYHAVFGSKVKFCMAPEENLYSFDGHHYFGTRFDTFQGTQNVVNNAYAQEKYTYFDSHFTAGSNSRKKRLEGSDSTGWQKIFDEHIRLRNQTLALLFNKNK